MRCARDMVVNEGGGYAFELDGRRFYTLCVGEKGVNRFLLRARGVAGHGSIPGIGENALLKLAPAVAQLRDQPAPEPTPEGVRFLSIVLEEDLDGADRAALAEAVERLRRRSPELATLLAEPMLERDPGADPDPGIGEVERDPVACGGADRHPGAARRRARAGP